MRLILRDEMDFDLRAIPARYCRLHANRRSSEALMDLTWAKPHLTEVGITDQIWPSTAGTFELCGALPF